MGRGPMPIHERLILSPWAKWRKHGRIPWKFIIHLVLAVLVTLQVVYVNEGSDYVDRTQASMLSMFVHPSLELVNRGPDGGEVYIYTYDDLARSLSFKVHNFYDIHKFVGEFSPVGVPELFVKFAPYAGNSNSSVPNHKKYELRYPPYGPFHIYNHTQMREAVGKMRTAEIVMKIHSVEPARPEVRKSPICWTWRIHALYDFTSHSRINLNFMMTWELAGTDPNTPCGEMNRQSLVLYRPHTTVFWVGMAILFLATLSLLLSIRSMHRSVQVYYLARRHYCQDATLHGPTQAFYFWKSLSFYDKLRFFNLWMIVTLAHSILCILSTVLYLFPSVTQDIHTHWWVHFTMGLAAALGWIHVTQYFEHDKELSVFLLALRTGFPYILRLVVAMGPIFFGYALFGWTFFGAFTPSFQSLGASMVSLFCIINGDDIHMTFKQFVREDQFIGRLYLTSFVIFFVYCVFNIFIYIMEDAIHNVKIMSRKHEMPGGSIFPKAPDNILDNDTLKEMLRPFNEDGEDALGERSRRTRSRLEALAQSQEDQRMRPPAPQDTSSSSSSSQPNNNNNKIGPSLASTFFSGRFNFENRSQNNLPAFTVMANGAQIASFDGAGEKAGEGEDINARNGGGEGGGGGGVVRSPKASQFAAFQPSISFFESGSSTSLQRLGGRGGSGCWETEEGLREPLLGSSQADGEGVDGHGMGAAKRASLEMESAANGHRMAVLEQLFHAQERIQRQHLQSFNESLQEIAEEHQNMLQESNRLFMEAMDRRLRKIFAVSAHSSNNLTSPPVLSRPSSPLHSFSLFFGGGNSNSNNNNAPKASVAQPPVRTLSGGRSSAPSAASALFPSLNRRNTLAGPEVERAARRAVENVAATSMAASPPMPPRRASSANRPSLAPGVIPALSTPCNVAKDVDPPPPQVEPPAEQAPPQTTASPPSVATSAIEVPPPEALSSLPPPTQDQ